MIRRIIPAIALLLLATAAFAQGPRSTVRGPYRPSRPVISPYLYLSRGNTGGVPSYYAWVKPQFDLARRQAQVDAEFSSIERRLLREPVPGEGQPITAATFMDYSHFYPSASGTTGRR
jgi:hypothetical protein